MANVDPFPPREYGSHRPTIWIVEDDCVTCTIYQKTLENNYAIRVFDSLNSFWTEWQKQRPEFRPTVVIADIILPDGHFLEFFQDNLWRQPIGALLVISSRDNTQEMRRCFAIGAADYLCKPVRPNELLVKVEKLSKEGIKPPLEERDAKIPIEFSTHTLHGPSGTCPLTAREMQILVVLFQADDWTLPKPTLVEKVWRGVQVGSRTLDVHTCHLRRKLRGVGYDLTLEKPDRIRIIRLKAL